MNILEQYSWTSLPNNCALRSESPYVTIIPYTLKGSQLDQFLQGYKNIVNMDPDDFYDKLYDASENGELTLPYLSDGIKSWGNKFAHTFSKVSSTGVTSGIADVVSKIEGFTTKALIDTATTGANIREIMKDTAEETNRSNYGGSINSIIKTVDKLTTHSTGSYLETPQLFQFNPSDDKIDVEFTLSNTMDRSDIVKNKEFIKYISKLCKPKRLNPISMSFPHIFEIIIPGQRHMRWATAENISISMVGNRRILKVGGKDTLVPEAYNIKLSFKSLIIEPANHII